MLRDLDCKNAKGDVKAYKMSDSHGLYLFVTPKGYRSWRWNYRFAGKNLTLTLGQYPEMSLADARIARAAFDKLRRQGTNPAKSRLLASAALANSENVKFESVARRWHASSSVLWLPKHRDNILRGMEKEAFPELGEIPIDKINAPTLLAILRRIEERGAGDRAHRLCQFLTSIFRFAIAEGITDRNPAANLKGALKTRVQGRRPALLTIEEAREFVSAFEASSAHPTTKLASRLIALTASRLGPVRMAEAHEFHLDAEKPYWHIPAAKMKLRAAQKNLEANDFIVPLAPQAVEVVKAALQLSHSRKYVFPAPKVLDSPMSDSTVSKAYRQLPGFAGRHVPHGWRSTFSTIMNERASERDRPHDRAAIELMLAHKLVGVEAAYNRSDLMPRRREIAEEWAELLIGSMPPASTLIEGQRG